ncbi:MAG: hypothetical protein SW019_20620 [Actinomycetota bacterium]|nr:hypothetical protein [Actinomycetota bacterium]
MDTEASAASTTAADDRPAAVATSTPTPPKICPQCHLQMLPRGVCGECE